MHGFTTRDVYYAAGVKAEISMLTLPLSGKVSWWLFYCSGYYSAGWIIAGFHPSPDSD